MNTGSQFDEVWREFHKKNVAVQEIPEGAITTAAYAALNNISTGAAHANLKALSDKGKLNTGMFRATASEGYGRLMRHWWPKK